MKTISKSVLQLTKPVIHEDDKDEFFDLLNQARDNIHWELESDAYDWNGTNYKYVLRYVPGRKEWAVYEIYAKTGKEVNFTKRWGCYKKYENALRTFNDWIDIDRRDKSKTKRIKPVFDTE